MKAILTTLVLLFLLSSSVSAQNDAEVIVKGAPHVFIKCWECDMTALKRDVNFINYVIQRQDADIVIIVTSQGTGAGEKYSIYFEGQKEYSGITDTIVFNVSDNDSEREVDDKIIAEIRMGLLPFIVNSSLRDKISYSVGIESDEKIEKIVDPWNSWVFTAGARGSFNGSSHSRNLSVNGSFYGSRITKEDKWRFSASSRFSERKYFFRDSNNVIIDSLTIPSEQKSTYFSGSYVKSLTDHLSIGAFSKAFSNTYSNYDLGVGLRLGVEYNFFNFEESDRRSLVLTYKIGGQYSDYVDTTIYDKLKENLFDQSLSINLYQKQKWGNVNLGASFSHYLHDIRINDLSLNANVDWNIVKGLTLTMGAYVSFINNQISLPKEEAGVIRTVLGDRLLSTDYSAYSYVGLSYTFGSKYANAVNPRFNSGGGRTYYFF